MKTADCLPRKSTLPILARVEKGLAVRGATAQHEPEQAGKAVVRWLERLSLMELK